MTETCSICGRLAEKGEELVTNVRTWKPECIKCCMPDNIMLRMVVFQTQAGDIEVHTTWATNNVVAMKSFWRKDVVSMRCVPLPN